MSDNNSIDPKIFVEGAKAAKEIAPKTISAIDDALSSVVNILNLLLIPITYFKLHSDHSLDKTRIELQDKLKNIDPEKIISPAPYIAVPALQAISYTVDCEELHNMFANLLATAMNEDTKDNAHPSYVEIIKQLSPLDAKILASRNFSEKETFPLYKIQLQEVFIPYSAFKPPITINSSHSYINILYPFALFSGYEHEPLLIANTLGNLQRLGLVAFSDAAFTRASIYDEIYDHIDFLKSFLNIEDIKKQQPELKEFAIEPLSATITMYGKSFIDVCVKNPC